MHTRPAEVRGDGDAAPARGSISLWTNAPGTIRTHDPRMVKIILNQGVPGPSYKEAPVQRIETPAIDATAMALSREPSG